MLCQVIGSPCSDSTLRRRTSGTPPLTTYGPLGCTRTCTSAPSANTDCSSLVHDGLGATLLSGQARPSARSAVVTRTNTVLR